MGTVHLDFPCGSEDVFAILADGWLYSTWVVGASRIREVDSTWPEPDARLHHSAGVWPLLLNDTTLSLEWAPPRRAVFQARGWPAGEAKVEITVTPGAGQCRVEITEDVTHGPFRVVPKPIRSALINPRNRESLRRLRFLAVGRAAGDAGAP